MVKVDYRTNEGLLVKHIRSDLIKHVGGNPNPVQRAIIERCVWLSLRLALLDRKLASGRDFTEIDSNVYLAWSNTLTRTIARLQPANGSSPSPNGQSAISDIMEEIASHDR